MTQNELRLRTLAQKNSLAITDIQLQKLTEYAEQLKDWNQRINLISRRDEENFWTNHLLVSVAVLFKVHLPDGIRVLDLGSGGGLPGIPLSILLPGVQFVLLDSIEKKVRALRSMIEGLGLSNASAVCSRAEDLNRRAPYAHGFDAVIARGVTSLDKLAQWGGPFLKRPTDHRETGSSPGGSARLSLPAILAIKGGDLQEEVKKTQRLFPNAEIRTIDLVFNGSETLGDSGKRILIVENLER